jgi:hypothetical protein
MAGTSSTGASEPRPGATTAGGGRRAHQGSDRRGACSPGGWTSATCPDRRLSRSRPRFITGGASNDLFDVTPGRTPDGPAPSADGSCPRDATRPCCVSTGCWPPWPTPTFPTPGPWPCATTPMVMGGCFYLMEYVDGWSPIRRWTGWPAPVRHRLRGPSRGLAFQLVDGIAKLSRVDWEAKGLAGFGRPDGFHERQVDRWMSHLAAVQFRDIPGLDVAADWLRSPPAPELPARDHARRLPVRQRHVPSRGAGPAGRHRRLGDGHGGRPAARPGLGHPGMARHPTRRRGHGSYVDYSDMPSRAELLDYYARPRADGPPTTSTTT